MHELVFIPVLAKALQSPDPQSALGPVLADLRRRGDDEDAHAMIRVFKAFMAEVGSALVRDRLAELEASFKADLCLCLYEDGADIPAEDRRAARELLQNDSHWPAILATIEAEERRRSDDAVGLALIRDGDVCERFELGMERRNKSVGSITPGCYEVELETGLRLWGRELGTNELIWTRALGPQPFRVAAATGTEAHAHTIEDLVMDGGLRIRVFPGLESGRLEIEWRREAVS